ncbi:hypothetical protein [Streptomyces spectabilis]|uniref:Uncharacterized protein n=1 Tax=Streptomyces spectabilis TaxID=68270 RepID=A0A516R0M4_STRST|nr:hypothetical protein [Streptomyces spectabilis]QDQ09204.1 hypothetical protein FH965_00325 [Streptomyces spectabilis]
MHQRSGEVRRRAGERPPARRRAPRLPRGLRALPAAPRTVAVVIGAVMLYGAVVHVVDLALWGFRSRAWAPMWLNAFWNSLIVFDALSGVLLLKARRGGLYLTCLTMLADLASNLYAVYGVRHSGLGAGSIDVIVLLAFGLFVLATAPWLRGQLPTGARASEASTA